MSGRPFRKSLEEKHQQPRRVFSVRFSTDDKRQQLARKTLESWELEYRDNHGIEAPLPHILTDMIHDYEFGKPSPMMTDKRLMNIVLTQLETMQTLLKAIHEREPSIVQQVIADSDGDTIDMGFIDNMFDDFGNGDGNRD